MNGIEQLNPEIREQFRKLLHRFDLKNAIAPIRTRPRDARVQLAEEIAARRPAELAEIAQYVGEKQ